MAQNQEDSKVKYSKIKGTDIALISIQSPPLNLLSGEVLMLVLGFLEEFKKNEKAKALIIRGKGLFSAGADINEIYAIAQEGSVKKTLEILDKANAVVNSIENLGKPTVAAITGLCLGGGNELAMGCTARIASEDSKFGQPEIKHGIMPGMGGTQRLPRLVSDLETSLKLLFSGELISVQDALSRGLVDEIAPNSELDSRALALAQRLIAEPLQRESGTFDINKFDRIVASDAFKGWTEKKSKDAVSAIIAGVRAGMGLSLNEALKLEQKLFAELVVKDSAKAGLAKLVGKSRVSKGGRFLLPSEKLPDIFTVGDLNEEQLLIRDSVREVVANTLAPSEASARIESKDFKFTRELMREFANLGVLGIEVPEEYGGVNLGAVVSAVVAEEISLQGSFACTFLAHTGIGTLPIRFFGTEEQKKKYLPKLISGEWLSSYCLTESGAGSDANSVRTRAIYSEGDTYNIFGEKIFVTNGGFADLYIVFAQLEDLGLTAFIVPRETRGLVVGKEEHKMGIQGSSTATIVLDNVRIPRSNILGEPGKGFKIAVNILNLGRFKLGAACSGAGKVCLSESVAYSKQRKQFGLPISNFGAIRRKLAEMAAKNYEMESVVYRTAGLLEKAIHDVDSNDSRAVLKAIEEFAVECSLVKVSCSEALNLIVDENIQIHGGSGFCEELPPARHYRDSRINRIFEGTNEVNRLVAIGMTLKKALMGSLPLLEASKNVVRELHMDTPPVEPEDVVERLNLYLNNAKKATLISFGMAYEKFGLELEKHQMVLMNLADCLMAVFVLESVLAAFVKNRTDMNLLMAQFIFSNNLHKLEGTTKELAGMCSEGDEVKNRLGMVNRLTGITPMNTEELCDKIVDNLLTRG